MYLNLVAKRNHFIAYSVRKSSKSLLQKHRKITYIYIYIYSTFSKTSPSRLFHQPLDLLLTNLVKTKLPFHLYSRLYLGPLKSTKVAIFKEPTRRGRKKKDDEEGKRRGGVFGSKRGNLVPRFSLFPFFILFIYSLLPSV